MNGASVGFVSPPPKVGGWALKYWALTAQERASVSYGSRVYTLFLVYISLFLP